MNSNDKNTFQIPNYTKPEPKKAQVNSNKPHSKPQNNQKSIFEDLLNKSADISRARNEAAEILRRI